MGGHNKYLIEYYSIRKNTYYNYNKKNQFL